jgi:hypothetical protein
MGLQEIFPWSSPMRYFTLASFIMFATQFCACGKTDDSSSTALPISGESGVAEFNVQGFEAREVVVDGGELNGLTLRLPGSSLASPATLQISESPSIASDVATDLGVTITSAKSRSVAVLPELDPATTALQEQMRLSIPLLSVNLSPTSEANYAIAFRCWIKGKAKTGLIKGDSVAVTNNLVSFKVKWFGVFQVVSIPDDVVAADITPQDSARAISGGAS